MLFILFQDLPILMACVLQVECLSRKSMAFSRDLV